MRPVTPALLVTIVAILTGGCGESEPPASPPPPAALTREAVGYFCGMIVADHPGPKAQLFIKGQNAPLWFTSARDAIAFTLLPEENKDIVAIYVTDMAKAASWQSPGDQAWIPARDAVYVIGSSRRGGMGAMEAVPFSDQEAAAVFAKEHGGQSLSWDAVPASYVLGGPEAKGERSVVQQD